MAIIAVIPVPVFTYRYGRRVTLPVRQAGMAVGCGLWAAVGCGLRVRCIVHRYRYHSEQSVSSGHTGQYTVGLYRIAKVGVPVVYKYLYWYSTCTGAAYSMYIVWIVCLLFIEYIEACE